MQHPWNYPPNFLQHGKVLKTSPALLQSALPVKYTMQVIIVPCSPPDDAEPGQEYATTVKHIYKHKTKIAGALCMNACEGVAYKIEYGRYFRVGLSALNYMFDRMGGCRFVTGFYRQRLVRSPHKTTWNEGHWFIREEGHRSNNRNCW